MAKTTPGRPVDIRILSRQKTGEDEPITQAVSGLCYEKQDEIILAYREVEEAGLGRTLTTLTIRPGEMKLTRRGEQQARMVFSEGERSTIRIRTPYGLIELDCLTHRVGHVSDEGGGIVRLDYVLEQGDLAPRIEVELRYRYT